jgi:glycosyltransferase involved in cell wall biosynthesis
MKPLVSIVIPVFNQEKFLRKTIESVLSQTYEEIECIVVDDGSTDHSLEIAHEYLDKIKCISQENSGQATALNNGWKISSGILIGYLSSDELLDSNAVEILVNEYIQHVNPVVVYGDYRLINNEGAYIKDVIFKFSDYKSMVRKFTCAIGPGALFPKEAFNIYGGFNKALRQIPDFDFWLRLGCHYPLVNVKKTLASFRVHANSQTYAVSDSTKADESLVVAMDLLGNYPSPIDREFLSNAYILSSCLHMRSGRFIIGSNRLLRSLLIFPGNFFIPTVWIRVVSSCLSRFRY